MPSFASEIRRQLASGTTSGTRRTDRAELAGLTDAAGKWYEPPSNAGMLGITFETPSAAVARSAVRLWRRAFGLDSKLSPAGTDRFGRARYSVRTEGKSVAEAAEELRSVRLSRDASGRTAYLSGAFQGCGSVVRPGGRGGHHLEFVHRDEEFIRRVVEFSRAELSTTRRRNRWVAYTKSSDGVATVLAQLGLHDAILEYEAKAILGEAKANANRLTNFDSANAGRTAKAAARQQKILESLDPATLPEALRDMLALRLEHPDASLAELASLGNISKSAANHRLRRLVERGGG